MRGLRLVLLALGLILATATGAAALEATAVMKGAGGEALGTVTLTQTPHGVLVVAKLSGIPPGGHGFHIHQTGSCAPDFKAAGGHFNPAGKGHGFNHAMGSHAGDMPNIYAATDGSVMAEVFNANVTLGPASLFDEDGAAIIIHAKPDTHGVSAGAGARIACGVIKPRG